MDTLAVGLITAAIGVVLGSALGALFTERGRSRFEAVRPTCSDIEGAWHFYYEFTPVIGVLNKHPTALADAGGSVRLSDRNGVGRHGAETIWAGSPPVGTATLYGPRGLLAFIAVPSANTVMFFSTGTAPHADLLKMLPSPIAFDWQECKDWTLEITASAPDASAATEKLSVCQLVTNAIGATKFPGMPEPVSDKSKMTDGELIKGKGPAIYIVENQQKRWIPDLHTFETKRYRFQDVMRVSEDVLDSIPRGEDVPRIF